MLQMRLRSRWEDTNRFACHFLGPDADEPMASSLGLIKDPDLCWVGSVKFCIQMCSWVFVCTIEDAMCTI